MYFRSASASSIAAVALGAAVLALGVMAGGCSSMDYNTAAKAPEPPAQSPYRPVSQPDSARYYYQTAWGIDNLAVRLAASGSLVRFSYRVTDATQAGVLGDKHAAPYLIDYRSRRVLQIPVLEQVGALWQTDDIQNGKFYWMAFSNKGGPVKVGDRVTVVVGSFHADGLVVE